MSEIEKNIRPLQIQAIDRTRTQTRATMNQAIVDDYAELMAQGVDLPEPIVFFAGEEFWLADGFHRVAAAEKIGRESIDCEQRDGGYLEALRYSLKANVTHGLRRTNEDKRHAVQLVLGQP